MTSRDEQILAFMNQPPHADAIRHALSGIEVLARRLEAYPSPNGAALAQRRILASNSLKRSRDQRVRWDYAQALIARHLSEPVDFLMIGRLYELLSGDFEYSPDCEWKPKTTHLMRTEDVYGCGDLYLSVEAFGEALELVNAILSGPDHALVKASRIYICLINAHFFPNYNGRIARLTADHILMSAGYPPLCFASNIHAHVAFAQADRFRSMDTCVLRCLSAVDHSYRTLLND